MTYEYEKYLGKGGMFDKAQYAYQKFLQKGYAPHHAAGIVGNLMQESGQFADDVISGIRRGDGGKAFGIAQWHPDRAAQMHKLYGANPSFDQQIEFVDFELNTRESLAKKKLQDADTAEEAALMFSKYYERPNAKYAANDKRAQYANQVLGQKSNSRFVSPGVFELGDMSSVQPIEESQQSVAAQIEETPEVEENTYMASDIEEEIAAQSQPEENDLDRLFNFYKESVWG